MRYLSSAWYIEKYYNSLSEEARKRQIDELKSIIELADIVFSGNIFTSSSDKPNLIIKELI